MEDKLVKLVKRQILVWIVVTSMVGLNQLWAQQTSASKQSSHRTAAKTIFVAQQPETSNHSATDSANSETVQNSVPETSPNHTTTPTSAQTQPGNTVTEEITTATSDQAPEVMANEMLGVDNGLWEGCDPGTCCAICGGGYCTPPTWYTEQGARIISHSAPRQVVLSNYLIGSIPVTVATAERTQYTFISALNTKDINYNSAAGYNATIGRYLGRDAMDRDDFLEFTYWGMNTWFDSIIITGQRIAETYSMGGVQHTLVSGNIVSNFPNFYANSVYDDGVTANQDVGGFNRADLQTYSVDSEMHNWELNLRLRPRGRPDQLVLQPSGRWRRECRPGTYMSYLVGLRYLTVGEGASWHSEGIINIDNGPDQPVRGDYIVKTENDLLGFQIGADLMFRRCKWSWGFEAKAGPCINFARNVQQALTDATGDPLSTITLNTGRLSTRKQNTTLIGEISILASYKFKPNLTGRASYDFMWISGLALAPEQFQLVQTPVAQINTNGTIFSHGVTLGLEWSW